MASENISSTRVFFFTSDNRSKGGEREREEKIDSDEEKGRRMEGGREAGTEKAKENRALEYL